jgi:hypothetical protein
VKAQQLSTPPSLRPCEAIHLLFIIPACLIIHETRKSFRHCKECEARQSNPEFIIIKGVHYREISNRFLLIADCNDERGCMFIYIRKKCRI